MSGAAITAFLQGSLTVIFLCSRYIDGHKRMDSISALLHLLCVHVCRCVWQRTKTGVHDPSHCCRHIFQGASPWGHGIWYVLCTVYIIHTCVSMHELRECISVGAAGPCIWTVWTSSVLFYLMCIHVYTGVSVNGRRQEFMAPPTAAAPQVRGHPLETMGHPPWSTGYGMLWIVQATCYRRGRITLAFCLFTQISMHCSGEHRGQTVGRHCSNT